jgi:hypothetical protein
MGCSAEEWCTNNLHELLLEWLSGQQQLTMRCVEQFQLVKIQWAKNVWKELWSARPTDGG